MFTFLVLCAIGYCWWRANKNYVSTGRWKFRRLRSSWIWAFVGAVIGSFFGVAGLESAIIGTVPGAVIGFLAASNLMKRDLDDDNSGVVKPEVVEAQFTEVRNDKVMTACPACGQQLRVPSGRDIVVKCSRCEHRFVFPIAGT